MHYSYSRIFVFISLTGILPSFGTGIHGYFTRTTAASVILRRRNPRGSHNNACPPGVLKPARPAHVDRFVYLPPPLGMSALTMNYTGKEPALGTAHARYIPTTGHR